MKKRKNEDGWTFMETLVVIAIILILSSTVGYVTVRNIPRSRIAAANSQIGSFMAALESYYIDYGVYPTEEQGLAALWIKPESITGTIQDRGSPAANGSALWKGPYLLKKTPLDPWGNPYVYHIPGKHEFPYEVVSYGEDGKEGGEGNAADITSWGD